ncbi:hypothetical protein FHX63_004513 [Cupriavidus plantarum]|uniref:Uncharacterized protein n=1 Tax=Cupriavidus plantarum TaxID=942865 RepID=A0A316ERR8_9BURK|nr:hypothetical protein [Cupriavidus plantarum]PWK33822.1 hypothetical protein C7419_103141 [Cupriavidus plantarum]REE90999.1 hypothetical protein C7418_4298 [Cupriavidus plantarum]RLK33672.1 hypothetical protein C7417_4322 [Cupriavidus plantarum]CAG2148229.1 hypothetical protein LMG26296_04283 [Cupriavidus plantarum]
MNMPVSVRHRWQRHPLRLLSGIAIVVAGAFALTGLI